MQYYGNLDKLKRIIKKGYDKKISEIRKEKRNILKAMKKDLDEKLRKIKEDFDLLKEDKVKEIKSSVYSEISLKVRRDLENEKELLFKDFLNNLKKNYENVIKSKDYIDYVLAKQPKDSLAEGPSVFRKYFVRFKENNLIKGVLFHKEGVVYDLTIDSLIEEKEDFLKQKFFEFLEN
ncbi:MAG: hypothetical protein N3D73_00045 [Candidatus Diapherotrites archaeon]|nr:hypothetical protein [Candidatus Diapherotrites archaeon]